MSNKNCDPGWLVVLWLVFKDMLERETEDKQKRKNIRGTLAELRCELLENTGQQVEVKKKAYAILDDPEFDEFSEIASLARIAVACNAFGFKREYRDARRKLLDVYGIKISIQRQWTDKAKKLIAQLRK